MKLSRKVFRCSNSISPYRFPKELMYGHLRKVQTPAEKAKEDAELPTSANGPVKNVEDEDQP